MFLYDFMINSFTLSGLRDLSRIATRDRHSTYPLTPMTEALKTVQDQTSRLPPQTKNELVGMQWDLFQGRSNLISNFARWKCFYFKLFHFVRLEVFEPNRHTWSPLNLSANISEWQFVYLLRQFVYRYSKKAGLCRRNIVFLNILFTLYHLFIFTSSIDSTNVLVANLKPLKRVLSSR